MSYKLTCIIAQQRVLEVQRRKERAEQSIREEKQLTEIVLNLKPSSRTGEKAGGGHACRHVVVNTDCQLVSL